MNNVSQSDAIYLECVFIPGVHFLILQVLFWGVRGLKRIQFQTVDKPRIDVECAGHVLSSSLIQNTKKNPNFGVPVKFFDVVSTASYQWFPLYDISFTF